MTTRTGNNDSRNRPANKNVSTASTNVTDLSAYRRKREAGEQQNGSKRRDRSESLADYYLNDGGSQTQQDQFENRLSSIKSTLDKLNILMEKISHLEKRQKL